MEGLLLVPRADFSIEEPWAFPAACTPVALRMVNDGSTPRLRTEFVAYADAEYLNVVFAGQDDGVVATHLRHDAPLYQEDVVEIFLAPDDPAIYYEIEVNPLGTTFDARINSPDGVRSTMRTEIEWDCDGLLAAVRTTPRSLETIIRIPFHALNTPSPTAGTTWHANFFRVDRNRSQGDEFMAWRPTMKTPADFHVAAAFGRMEFN